ncbi:MAG TPA: bifunctional diaminohydroxyphosphoribosylaminopyrimidine deaminase/5-amino-6-(5-phosphoribosylamino)uracil reductase RibD [Steroidobacteraceae bacterium]|jgi:diaminohydroxyphosphoribosylaminopyrimidine deaminase/5-amino-6-(5-phosphoribosylamino)uracil reductase|nr:bifunctional diaminohydroxyphosphoribosylaminopyrimidine deaminase/5-amino-6-(5-phosphoribosylamino)uracil reductase RibD [Steroidobacteraceae bacterium]
MNDSIAAQDLTHLQHALELAARGLFTTDPNPRVGCVIAQEGRVLGEGWHARAGEPHAEVFALRAAGAQARGATAYVSLEPCSHTGRTPPCADALIAAGAARVVCCTRDPDPRVAGTGLDRLRKAGISVQVGAFAEEARRLNIGYFSRHERGRPYVRLKLAMSLDGRTAAADGRRLWISGEASRADVQNWRARSSAVLTGAGTVRADDPLLNVRLGYGPWVRQPLRVVLDTMLTIPRGARILEDDGALILAAAEAPLGAFKDIKVERIPRAPGGLDLEAVLQNLTARGVNELLVECGPTLAGAFLAQQLVDEMVLYLAPKVLGDDAPPLLRIKPAAQALPAVEFRDAQRFGEDMRLILQLRKH